MTATLPRRGGCYEEACALEKQNKAACLHFAREHLEKPEAFWKSILWSDGSRIWSQPKPFGKKVNTAYHQKNHLQ